mgnify:CR=1 FL=1
MSFNAERIANEILNQLKLAKIENVATCMTRLRVSVANQDKVDLASIKAINGVLGIVEASGQIQIIIGPGKVNQVYDALMPLLANLPDTVDKDEPDKNSKTANQLKEVLKQKNATPFKLSPLGIC